MKELLKKLRWKWHRDISELIDEKSRFYERREEEQKQALLRNISEKLDVFQQKAEDREQKEEAFRQQTREALSVLSKQSAELSLETAKYLKKTVCLEEFADWVEMGKAYSLLSDRESQKIFWARMQFSKNKTLAPLFRYLIQSERAGNPVDLISFLRDRLQGRGPAGELVLFGMTAHAKELFLLLEELGCKVDYICREDDENLAMWGTGERVRYDWKGRPILTEEELLKEHKNAQIVIGDVFCARVKRYLMKNVIPKEHIWRRHTQWELQYLDPEIMRPHTHEVYVDGGVLDLQNTIEFIEWCHGEYDAVYAFEPDSGNYERCMERIRSDSALDENRVHLFHSALFSRDTELSFSSESNSEASSISSAGKDVVSCRSIDSVLQGRPVTFIKLDIEGAEMAALRGAKESVKKWKPRLAVCIYHRAGDPVDIPLYIHGLVPEYKMYIRHYSTCRAETVLYCVREEET